MNADPINIIHTNQQPTKEDLNEELEVDFRSSKSINLWKKSEQPTETLAMTFHKPAGEDNWYSRFVYGPQTIF